MSTLSTLSSPSAGAAQPPPSVTGALEFGRPEAPLQAIGRSQAPRDALHGWPRPPESRAGRDGAGRDGVGRNAGEGAHGGPAAAAPRPQGGAGAQALQALESLQAGSAPFLVQAFGQANHRPIHVIAGHRDAADLGSAAYRRAGGAPPIYSERPTLFRITA